MEEDGRVPPKYGKRADNGYVNHIYHDLSRYLDDGGEILQHKKIGANFPAQLHKMLSKSQFSHIISWMPHGRAWKILDRELLMKKVVPRYFIQTKFASFIRQLSGWGFKRLHRPGPDHGCYYHVAFLRGIPKLTGLIVRMPPNKGKTQPFAEGEPNFYKISLQYPLPPPSKTIALEHGDYSSIVGKRPAEAMAMHSVPQTKSSITSVGTEKIDYSLADSVAASSVGAASVAASSVAASAVAATSESSTSPAVSKMAQCTSVPHMQSDQMARWRDTQTRHYGMVPSARDFLAASSEADIISSSASTSYASISHKIRRNIAESFSQEPSSSSFAASMMMGDLVTSPDDGLFDEIERYIHDLSIKMKRISNEASGLVRKSKEFANNLFEFGLAVHQLGQSEGEGLGLGLGLGSTSDTLSSIVTHQAESKLKRLEGLFIDYINIIQAVKIALNRRHDKRVSYTALLRQIQTIEGSLHRLRMTPGNEAKVYSTEMSLQPYHAAANVAYDEYAEGSGRLLREVDRFKRERAKEMKMAVMEFIMLEIEVNRSMGKVLEELVPKLDQGSVDLTASENYGRGSQQQGAMVNVPPSQLQPPLPSASAPATSALPPSSRPMHSNVPAPVLSADPIMEGSIQFRNNNLPGVGL